MSSFPSYRAEYTQYITSIRLPRTGIVTIGNPPWTVFP